MQTEQAVKMAAKLYECRDTAKRVFGDGYHKRMEAYGQVVKSAANALNCSDVAAATTLANKAGGGMAAICYLAAVVEMTEPSNNQVQRDAACGGSAGTPGYAAQRRKEKEMAIGPNVVDDCEGMTEEDYWRGMDEAMQDEEGDEPFCNCTTGHSIEETDWNQCDSCGKPIYDEEPAVSPAPTFASSNSRGWRDGGAGRHAFACQRRVQGRREAQLLGFPWNAGLAG